MRVSRWPRRKDRLGADAVQPRPVIYPACCDLLAARGHLKVDSIGRVYCTGPGGIWVVAPDGRRVGIIRWPEQAVNFAFGGPDLNFGNGRGVGVLSSRSAQLHGKGIMLGRHVYRVHPTDQGWTLTKEGEDHPRADFPGREDAIAEAVRLAEADEPAKVIIDNGNGTITDEWLFGADFVDELNM